MTGQTHPLLPEIFAKLDKIPTPVTLADRSQPDCPLVYANLGFHRLTGHDPADVLGKNCRFLQGPLTEKRATQHIKDAITDNRAINVCLLNYRKTGEIFHNFLFLSPLKAVDGLNLLLGCQYEFTMLPNPLQITDQINLVEGLIDEINARSNYAFDVKRENMTVRSNAIRMSIEAYIIRSRLSGIDI